MFVFFRRLSLYRLQATLLFYGKLFEQNPDVKVLFKGGPDMLRVQAKRLFKMLDTAVAGLSGDLNELVTVLKDLGRRHVGVSLSNASAKRLSASAYGYLHGFWLSAVSYACPMDIFSLPVVLFVSESLCQHCPHRPHFTPFAPSPFPRLLFFLSPQYGVVEAHYAVVGGALLATLEAALSPSGKWTPEAKGAWTAVYGVIASTMKDGAKLDPEWAANEASWEARKAAAKAAAAGSYFDGINWTTVAASVAAIAVVGVTVMARFRDSRT